ncbi:MAG: energy-coupled thiamine transporter ThiT [Clostridia bacterium]|nr:energy-coupled thiamine transporter ThiT [Clostridia bacterium]
MFLSSLLAVSDAATKTVTIISIVAVAVLFVVIALICIKGKKDYDAKRIAFAGLTVGLSFALSYVKFSPVTSGGSVTLASMVPLLVYAYFYGLADGLLAGTIFGLLNFISGPWILTPMTFFLDYPLAYASIGLMGLAKKFGKNTVLQIALGTFLVYAVRFLFHFASGAIYFLENSIWVEFPDWALSGPFIYSFIYQCLYLPFDMLISLAVLTVLAKTRVLERLQNFMKK